MIGARLLVIVGFILGCFYLYATSNFLLGCAVGERPCVYREATYFCSRERTSCATTDTLGKAPTLILLLFFRREAFRCGG